MLKGESNMKSSIKEIKERREEIIDLLFSEENNSKTVKNLATTFQVSEMTIRRDLNHLQEIGLVNRFHGGASLIVDTQKNKSKNEYMIERIKEEISKKAAEYINDNSTLYINSGTTALNIVDHLKKLSLIIVSNNIRLYQKDIGPNSTVIITGGEVRLPKEVLVGSLAMDALSTMHADIAVMSCSGISAEKGVTTDNPHEARINKLMINNTSGIVILVADYRKVGKDTNFMVTELADIDILITDAYSDIDAIRKIEESGVTVVQVNV